MRHVFVALLLALGLGVSGEAIAGRVIHTARGTWQTTSTAGVTESYTKTIGVGKVDTIYFDISMLTWEADTNTVSRPCARLCFAFSAAVGSDSMYYAVEVIAPDGTVVPSTTFNGITVITAGDKVQCGVIECDADAVLPNIAFVKKIRLRVRPQSLGTILNARGFLTFYAEDERSH